MFYFSLDHDGLIQAHTFDKKISNMRTNLINANSYPWLRSNVQQWSSELISGRATSRSQLDSILNTSSKSEKSQTDQNILDLLSAQ